MHPKMTLREPIHIDAGQLLRLRRWAVAALSVKVVSHLSHSEGRILPGAE
jgi:hypothetical protein